MLRRLTLASVIVLVAATAFAQKWNERDRAELNAFKLTMERLNQVDRVMEAMARRIESDPAMQAKIKRQNAIEAGEVEPTEQEAAEMEKEEAEEANAGDSLDAMERKFTQLPHFAEAIRAGGLTPREFALTQLALFQAAFAHAMKKQGYLKEVPKEIPAHQVEFVAQHEKEIEALSKKWQDLNKRFEGKSK